MRPPGGKKGKGEREKAKIFPLPIIPKRDSEFPFNLFSISAYCELNARQLRRLKVGRLEV
jgi:hypothetical protein